jgi:hypothetical protein
MISQNYLLGERRIMYLSFAVPKFREQGRFCCCVVGYAHNHPIRIGSQIREIEEFCRLVISFAEERHHLVFVKRAHGHQIRISSGEFCRSTVSSAEECRRLAQVCICLCLALLPSTTSSKPLSSGILRSPVVRHLHVTIMVQPDCTSTTSFPDAAIVRLASRHPGPSFAHGSRRKESRCQMGKMTRCICLLTFKAG